MQINGVVLSLRPKNVGAVSIWNRSTLAAGEVADMIDQVAAAANVDVSAKYYLVHKDSINWNRKFKVS